MRPQLIVSIIMQKQLLSKTLTRPVERSTSLQPIIGKSAYLVNNSLYCSMQPKRTSFDIKLFLQLHRKLTRKAVIEKTFEQSLYQFSNQVQVTRKGFKGNAIPERRITYSVSNRQKKVKTESAPKVQQASNAGRAGHSSGVKTEQGQRGKGGLLSSHTKPNMMYNLSLYRKNFKRKGIKNDKACMKIIKSFSRTSDQFTHQRLTRKTSKLITIS